MDKLEKLLKAKELLLEIEDEYIKEQGHCPYEIGYTIRNLDEALKLFDKSAPE